MRGILHHLPQYLGKKTKARDILDLLEKLQTQPSHFCDFLISILNINFEKRQEMLEELNVCKRLETVFDCLMEEEENQKIDFKIKERMQNQIGKNHKEFYLNEQMKAIQKELGEDGKSEIGGLKEKLLAAKRSGIYEVVIPIGNQKHLEEIPKKILEGMKIHLAETIWTVLKIVLLRMPQIVNDSDITSKNKEKEISNVLKKSSLLELENSPEEKL